MKNVIEKNLELILISFILIHSILGGANTAMAQSSLHVQAGETVRFDDEDVNIIYHDLILEDNATIILGPWVKNFNIAARRVRIGDNVKLIQYLPIPQDGSNGIFAANGSKGNNGANVTLQLQIESIGSMLIDVSGANGGNGGNGTNGSRGSNASCTPGSAGDGEDGGSAGYGGSGGNGGNVTVKFSYLDEDSEYELMGHNSGIKIVNEGGTGGSAGAVGKGGRGGKGHDDCGIWPYYHVGSGDNGKDGSAAYDGYNGEKGKVKFIVL